MADIIGNYQPPRQGPFGGGGASPIRGGFLGGGFGWGPGAGGSPYGNRRRNPFQLGLPIDEEGGPRGGGGGNPGGYQPPVQHVDPYANSPVRTLLNNKQWFADPWMLYNRNTVPDPGMIERLAAGARSLAAWHPMARGMSGGAGFGQTAPPDLLRKLLMERTAAGY